MSYSSHLIDPELRPMLDFLPPLNLPHLPLATVRERLDQFGALIPEPEGFDVAVEERRIPRSGGGEIGLLIYRPRGIATPAPGVLHMHGGGYVAGTAALSRVGNMVTASLANCIIVSVDYRLAPETPHPGPLEDCYDALVWMAGNAGAIGVDGDRIAVMGESAGGGLAATLAQLARDRGEVRVVHQHLMYPMLDDRTCRADPPFAGEFVWNGDANRFGWAALLGHEPAGDAIAAYAAAARCEALEGLPPAFIAVGALDLFADEDIDYGRRLVHAGVPVELHVYPGAFHVFDAAPEAAVAQAARRDSIVALTRALHPGTPAA